MNLRDWQARHGFTYDTAAEELGISRRQYARYLKMKELPKKIALACEALDARKEKKNG